MAKKSAKNYSQLYIELDKILSELENTDTDVDEAVELYQRGTTILKELNDYLGSVENSIKQINSMANKK